MHYFESSKWHREVSNIAGEGARNHGLLNIAVGDFFNTAHYIPSNNKEQQKIAALINLITVRIDTQIKIIEDLKKLKSAN
jgi:type I restriction enzyme S subunit